MKVKAIKEGGFYDNKRVSVGEVFLLKPVKGYKRDPKTQRNVEHTFSPEDQFSSNWMERVEDYVPVQENKPARKAKKSKPVSAEAVEDSVEEGVI